MKCLSGNHSNETHEQYFPVVLSILLCKMVLTFESVDKIPVSQHSGSWIFGDKEVTVIGVFNITPTVMFGM